MRHHSLICSGSVVAFSCQPANSGRLFGPAGKTGRSAAAKSRAAVRFGSSERVAVSESVCIFTLFVSVEFVEAARIRRGPGIEPLTTGSRRSFHQALTAAAMVPLPPVVKRKAGGCGCNPPRFLPSLFWSDTVDPLTRPIVRVGTARGVANGVGVRCVQRQRLLSGLEVKDDLLRFVAVETFERHVWCALNRSDARFAFQVRGLQVFTFEYFIFCHFITFSVACCPSRNCKVRDSVGLSKLDCTQTVQPSARATMTQRTLLSVGGHSWPSGSSLVTARTMIIAGFPPLAGEQVESASDAGTRREANGGCSSRMMPAETSTSSTAAVRLRQSVPMLAASAAHEAWSRRRWAKSDWAGDW